MLPSASSGHSGSPGHGSSPSRGEGRVRRGVRLHVGIEQSAPVFGVGELLVGLLNAPSLVRRCLIVGLAGLLHRVVHPSDPPLGHRRPVGRVRHREHEPGVPCGGNLDGRLKLLAGEPGASELVTG